MFGQGAVLDWTRDTLLPSLRDLVPECSIRLVGPLAQVAVTGSIGGGIYYPVGITARMPIPKTKKIKDIVGGVVEMVNLYLHWEATRLRWEIAGDGVNLRRGDTCRAVPVP